MQTFVDLTHTLTRMKKKRPEHPWIPVGIDGIADYLGVSQNTVVTWRRRSAREWVNVPRFPEPAGKISGRDWWWLADVLDWARATGRLSEQGTPRAHHTEISEDTPRYGKA